MSRRRTRSVAAGLALAALVAACGPPPTSGETLVIDEGAQLPDCPLDALDGALARISRARSELGAVENRLRSGIRQLGELQQSTAQARSRIADADFAIEAAAQARDLVLQQAQVAVQAQANITSSLALSLLT